MRPLLCLLLVGGCFGTLDANGRPAVIPKLSALPADAEKRDAVLDQSGHTTEPENGKGMTTKERKAVTTAAFMAAIFGSIFSKSQNVMLGTATTIEENHLVEKPRKRPAGDRQDGEGGGSGSGSEAAPPDTDPPVQLAPWIKLHP